MRKKIKGKKRKNKKKKVKIKILKHFFYFVDHIKIENK